jgi:non-ribosomal peptide synthetase component F
LVEELHPERNISRNPLFQVTFQLFSSPRWLGVSSEQVLDLRSVEIGTAKFDLRFDLVVTPQGLNGFFEYNTALFDAATITRMIERLQALLEGIVANPALRLSEFPSYTEPKQERLPEDMLPLDSVLLGSPPLTPNVGVDHQALPAPNHRGAERGVSFVAPTTEVERTIATAWQEVLGLVQVGVGDNFFDLGGHSLLLVQLQSKLREVLGREVAILDLLRYPTVSALAKALRPEAGEALVFEIMQERVQKQRAAMSRRKPGNLGRTDSEAVT